MSYRYRHVEQGIIYINWIGQVGMDELEQGIRDAGLLAEEHGDVSYVAVLDLTECLATPFDRRGLERLVQADQRVSGYVIVQPSSTARVMGDMFTQITHRPFRMVAWPSQALPVARQMLQTAA